MKYVHFQLACFGAKGFSSLILYVGSFTGITLKTWQPQIHPWGRKTPLVHLWDLHTMSHVFFFQLFLTFSISSVSWMRKCLKISAAISWVLGNSAVLYLPTSLIYIPKTSCMWLPALPKYYSDSGTSSFELSWQNLCICLLPLFVCC